MDNDWINRVEWVNDIFIHHFPDVMTEDQILITPEQSHFYFRFEDYSLFSKDNVRFMLEESIEPSVVSFTDSISEMGILHFVEDIMGITPKHIFPYSIWMRKSIISKRLDDLLWNKYDILKEIFTPYWGIGVDLTDLEDDLKALLLLQAKALVSLKTSKRKVKLNQATKEILIEPLAKKIELELEDHYLLKDNWKENLDEIISNLSKANEIKMEAYSKQLENYYAYHLKECIEWESRSLVTDKHIFIYRILLALGFDCSLEITARDLDENSEDGTMRREVSEYIKCRCDSHVRWLQRHK